MLDFLLGLLIYLLSSTRQVCLCRLQARERELHKTIVSSTRYVSYPTPISIHNPTLFPTDSSKSMLPTSSSTHTPTPSNSQHPQTTFAQRSARKRSRVSSASKARTNSETHSESSVNTTPSALATSPSRIVATTRSPTPLGSSKCRCRSMVG